MRYIVLGRPFGLKDQAGELRERLYRDFKAAWSVEFMEVDARLGREFVWRSDAFLRQDYLAALMDGDKAACLHSYSLHDLTREYEWDKSYLRDVLTESALGVLRGLGVSSFMSMEHFIIMPEYRGGRELVNTFDAMVCLGLEFFHARAAAGAVVTLTRNAKSINKFLTRLEFRSILEDLTHNGEPADLMVYDSPVRAPHKRADMERRIRELWENRLVLEAFPLDRAFPGQDNPLQDLARNA